MDITNILVAIIYVCKLSFIILGIVLLHLKYADPKYKFLENTILQYKNIAEFVGLLLFSLLLLDLFNPLKNGIYVSGEIQYMLFLSGIILFITLKWSDFFKLTKTIKETQRII